MAARTNKRDPRAARTLRRISFVREVKQSFLIICEGVNTEPDYFNAFRLTSANIKAVGQGLNTVGLVQKALRMKEEERKKGREYDQCWVVFDKDDFPDRDFNRAIGMAEAGGMRVAYSNQAQAITNAKAVLRRMEGIPPAQAESSTTVHLLVEELNKYI